MPLDSIVNEHPLCRNIVIFGEVGVGKSSVINLIANEERAATSSSAKVCTQRTQEHIVSFDSVDFALHDTVGLQDSAGKKNKITPSAVNQAYTLISKLESSGGVHLLMFCMKGGGRISTMAQQAYNLFVDVLCNRQVPVVIVVTHLETYGYMEEWWNKMENDIQEHGLHSAGHICITATRGLKNRLEDRYHQSRDEIRKLLLQYSNLRSTESIRVHRPRHTQWNILTRRADVPSVKQIRKNLIDRYGFPLEWAKDLARIMQTSGAEFPLNLELPDSPEPPSSISPSEGHRPIEEQQLQSRLDTIHRSADATDEKPNLLMSSGQLHPEVANRATKAISNVVESFRALSSEIDQPLSGTGCQSDFPYEDLTSRITGKGDYATRYGAYGDIWMCDLICGDSLRKVAVKAVRPPVGEGNNTGAVEKKLRRELKIWARLRHENVVPLFGVASGFGPLPSMVCPWIENGSLSGYLQRRHADLKLIHRLALLHDVAVGLRYLHSHEMPVVHGDIHSDNILIDRHGKALLSDFGLSLVIQEFLGTSYLQSSVHGCVQFAAPELFPPFEAGQNVLVYPTSSADVYSFGCVMLHVLSSQKPFAGMSNGTVLIKLTQGQRPPLPDDHGLHPDHHAFIQRCWAAADERPSIEDVVAFILAQLTSSLILCRQWTGPGSRPTLPD